MTVRVVSYNLLVPIYALQPEYYLECPTEYLQTDYRWNLIQSQLKQEITDHENTVICLQEISLTLLPEMILFFRQLNYSFFHNLYGDRKSDYMGVGIAIPVSMQVNSIAMIKIGDRIRSIVESSAKQDGLDHLSIRKSMQLLLIPWDIAMLRSNTLICIQVLIDSKPLWIGTYHMPCLYQDPDIMAIHTSVVKDSMFELVAGQDLIFTGDFNIKPSENCYRTLTEKGYVDDNFPNSSDYNISYRPNTEQVSKSAYREKNGTEPVYTNWSSTPNSPNFCATLDYILFFGRLTVEDVLQLPDHPISKSYPDQTHPSDHLMIAATFRFV